MLFNFYVDSEMGALIYGNYFLWFCCFQWLTEIFHSGNLDPCHWQIWSHAVDKFEPMPLTNMDPCHWQIWTHAIDKFGPMPLTNLKVVKRTDWSVLWLIGSQFNILNSFCDTWAILSRLRHLFWVVWILFFNILLRLGYHAEYA